VPGFANVRAGINLSAGTGQAHTGTVVLSNSNGVTFGAQASASSTIVTMSGIAGLSSAIQSISAGTAMLTQGMVVFSNANGIVFGANGQTITMGMNTASAWSNDPIPFDGQISIPGSSTTVNLSFQRVSFLAPINATRADMLLNMSVLGSTAGSFTISIGLYTFAGSTASSVSTTSAAVSWNSGTNTDVGSIYGGQSSLRWRSVALGTWNIVPGEYLVGINISISGVAGSTAALSAYGRSYAATLMAPGGGDYTKYFANGLFSVGTGALPASVHLSAINQTFSGSTFGLQPNFQLAGTF
jgi:hypothetical protein